MNFKKLEDVIILFDLRREAWILPSIRDVREVKKLYLSSSVFFR